MSGFLIILGLFLCAFSTSANIIDINEEITINSTFKNLGKQWLLMFGEFEDDPLSADKTIILPILFLIATAILPMILLNLVIAIMSDTYENVVTNGGDSDNKQLNTMMLQFENLMFWKRE